MNAINITNARKNLYQIVSSLQDSHEPIHISGKNGNAVMVSDKDWQAIEETLYLLSVPGMRASIVEGLTEPIEDCSDKLDW